MARRAAAIAAAAEARRAGKSARMLPCVDAFSHRVRGFYYTQTFNMMNESITTELATALEKFKYKLLSIISQFAKYISKTKFGKEK